MVFRVTVYTEDDGSITLSMDDMDLAVNAPRKKRPSKHCAGIWWSMRRNTAKSLPRIPQRLTGRTRPSCGRNLAATPQELRDALVFHPEQMRPKHPHKTVTERLEEYYHTPVDQINPTKRR